jgi:Uma2 family endonuclease
MGVMRATRPATSLTEVYYPESDGKPMAETDLHRDEMFELIAMLKARYEQRPDVYVSGNLLLYYVEGDPTRSVAPDVFVVFGVSSDLRRVYKLWAEGVPPAVVIEVTSRKTKGEDLRSKRGLYARLGVSEYYLYDPEADYLRPPLQGFRLAAGSYELLPPDSGGTITSAHLGLGLRLVDGRLQFYDGATGNRLPRLRERAQAAEAEVARLRAELARLRGPDDRP